LYHSNNCPACQRQVKWWNPPRAGKLVDLVAFGYRAQIKTMITLYVIGSLNKKFRYVGITNNLKRRLDQHNRGKNQSTKSYAPFKIIYTEEYNDYNEALVREKFLKSGVGRTFIDNLS
jgi:putative endonuclease